MKRAKVIGKPIIIKTTQLNFLPVLLKIQNLHSICITYFHDYKMFSQIYVLKA